MSFRWVADENLNNDILRAVRRRKPGIDIVRVQDVGLTETEDPALLAWAADNGRILLTHDVSTITAHAYDRMRAGRRVPGVIEIDPSLPISHVADDICLLEECATDDDLENRVLHLPLR